METSNARSGLIAQRHSHITLIATAPHLDIPTKEPVYLILFSFSKCFSMNVGEESPLLVAKNRPDKHPKA